MTDPTAPPVPLTADEIRALREKAESSVAGIGTANLLARQYAHSVLSLIDELDAQRATVARLTAEQDHWRDQFDLLRADLVWTPSEQANEISRLTNTLNDAGAKLARLTQENETLKKEREQR